jgi:hypothetical protein
MRITPSFSTAGRSNFSRISVLLATVGLLVMSSCEKEPISLGSGTRQENGDTKEVLELPNGHPSDLTVRRAAWTMNTTYIDMPFKRGQVLEALGGGGVPVGTLLYPIKFEDFPYPIYLSRDEFGDWRFNIGEKPTLHSVRTPPPPETEKEKKAREKKEAENVKAAIAAAELTRKAAVETQKKAEEEQRRRSEEIAHRSALEREQRKAEEERNEREKKEGDERTRRETYERLRSAGERQRKEIKERDQAIAREMEETSRKLGQGSTPTEEMEPDETTEQMPITSSPKEVPSEPKVSPSSYKAVRLAEAKAELAVMESKISTERQRFQQASDTINRLTNFKKTPVKEGSAAYRQCLDASRVIQEVEQKAPSMTAEKTRLATLIAELEME